MTSHLEGESTAIKVVQFTFTKKNEPERHNVTAHQEFTDARLADEFFKLAKSSELLKNVTLKENEEKL